MKQQHNGRVQVDSVLSANIQPTINEINNHFNQSITKVIEEGRAYTASDDSVSDREMVRFWCVKDTNQNSLLQNKLYHKEW